MTTSAAKDMFLPPLTTLVTRLMLTTWSFRLSRFASIFFFVAIMSFPAFWPPASGKPFKKLENLELQASFASCIGERLDAAVIQVATAIEDHLLDALLLCALGDQFANFSSRSDVATGLL